MNLSLGQLREAGSRYLPGLLGVDVYEATPVLVRARLEIEDRHGAPNGFLHAGTIVTLADTACGYGCILSLPESATGFTTIELKTNFLRSARSGTIECEARLAHGGRTTQVWDATVTGSDGKTMALFRCTQLILAQEPPQRRLPAR